MVCSVSLVALVGHCEASHDERRIRQRVGQFRGYRVRETGGRGVSFFSLKDGRIVFFNRGAVGNLASTYSRMFSSAVQRPNSPGATFLGPQ